MASDQDTKRPLILSADDDYMIQQIVENLVSDFAEVIIAENTVEAEQMMRAHSPDLVLLDDIMPGGMTGLQFLDHIRADEELADIPVIMVTASDKPTEVLRGLASGAVEYITKPFKPEELLAVIKKRFEHHTPQINIVIDDAVLEDELVDTLTHLQCDVDSILPENFDYMKVGEQGCDLVILACATARDIAQYIYTAKKDGVNTKLYVVAMVEDDVLDQEQSRIFFMPASVPTHEILKKVGQLLKPGQN